MALRTDVEPSRENSGGSPKMRPVRVRHWREASVAAFHLESRRPLHFPNGDRQAKKAPRRCRRDVLEAADGGRAGRPGCTPGAGRWTA